MTGQNDGFCCQAFRVKVVGDKQIEHGSNGEWCVNGCCGGGCYVLTDIRFCPYCGARLAAAGPEASRL